MSLSTLRPIGTYALSGLASYHHHLLALDQVRGYLVAIEPVSQRPQVLNALGGDRWMDASGLAVWDNTLWFTQGNTVFSTAFSTKLSTAIAPNLSPNIAPNTAATQTAATQTATQTAVKSAPARDSASESTQHDDTTDTLELDRAAPTPFAQLPYPAQGVAVDAQQVYVTCQKSGYIHVFERSSGEPVGKFPQPGIGEEGVTIHDDALWVCDRTEQTVYCLDKTTGELRFSALTPYPQPTDLAFYAPKNSPAPVCYVAYADEEPYIRDDPNAADPFQLTFRDRTFIHPIHIHRAPTYTRSNGYLVEVTYIEELLPTEDAITLNNVEWRMALPANTHRQIVRDIAPIGHPFTLEEQAGQQVAVFKFDQLSPERKGIIGWKATLELYGLKYILSPSNVEEAPPLSPEFQQQYLIDDDELAMDTDIIQAAAKEAVGTETNILRKALKIRNYLYDRLSYSIQPKIDTPDVALARGTASCGEYVGLLLALFRLNGIACRTVGRYKCPPHPDKRHLPLAPDFNHVWLEFYVPGIGWLPMESNVDDVIDRGPYPTRFFMGLAWYHTEFGKGIPFGKLLADNRPERLSISDFSINHIRFTILDELIPTAP